MMSAESLRSNGLHPIIRRVAGLAVSVAVVLAPAAAYVKGAQDERASQDSVAEAFQNPDTYKDIVKRDDEAIDTIPAARVVLSRSIDRDDAVSMAEDIAQPENVDRMADVILEQSEGEPGPVAVPMQFVDHEAVKMVQGEHAVIPTVRPQ